MRLWAPDAGDHEHSPRWLAQFWQREDGHLEGHPLLAARPDPPDGLAMPLCGLERQRPPLLFPLPL